MSYVNKAYDQLDRMKGLFNTKIFRFSLVLIASLFLFFGTFNVYAQSSTTEETTDASTINLSVDYSGIENFQNVVNGATKGEKNISTQTGVSVANALYTGISLIAPGITQGGSDLENDSDIPTDMKNGLLGTADYAVTYAYTGYPSSNISQHLAEEWVPGYKDASTSVYAEDSSTQNMDGYSTLMATGIAPLWNKIRDIAYVFFVVVMIVTGFMIMFRTKIGGQTLVTLGNFLPGVITSLILITFSFAIAGIIIDFGGLITSIVAGLYDGNVIPVSGFWNLMKTLFTGYQAWTVTGINAAVGGTLTAVGAAALKAVIAATGAASLGTIFTLGAGLILLLLLFAILGIVLVGAVKVLFVLYKAFFGILIDVITGPIQIMVGAFPGQNVAIGNWLRSLFRNVLTFPMVFAIINLPNYIDTQSNVTLTLPTQLTYGNHESMSVGVNYGFGGFLFMFVLKVVVLYFAAEAPKFLEAWFPPNTPKAVAEGFANARASLGKIPLVGGLFK